MKTSMSKETILKEVIRNRRSVRHFKSDPIPREKLLSLIEAGTYAPSGSNSQNQRFLILDKPDDIQSIACARFVWPYPSNQGKMREAHPNGILGNAAALILVFADACKNDRRGNGEYFIWETLEIQNCAASIQNILLMATANGIASCWVSACEKMSYTRLLTHRSWRSLLAHFQIPEGYKIQGIIALGYPKNTDHQGFPCGESMHGATTWQSTERKSVDFYVIDSVNETDLPRITSPSHALSCRLRFLSFLIFSALRFIRFCDKSIHKLETKACSRR